MHSRISTRLLVLGLFSLFTLASCGGGGSGQATPKNELNLNLDVDYRTLGPAERTEMTGLDDAERAALRLWKRQVLAAGKNDGGIYFNVLNNPQDFSPAEVAHARNFYNEETSTYSHVNGKVLDRHFFEVTQKITGENIASHYEGAPPVVASGPINLNNIVTGNNGLGSFDNAVIRLWVHDPLDNGAMDGSITKFTLLSAHALDSVDGSPGSLDPEHVKALLAADLASGSPDGTPLQQAFSDVLDAIYFGGSGSSIAQVISAAGIDQAEADALFTDWADLRGYNP